MKEKLGNPLRTYTWQKKVKNPYDESEPEKKRAK